MNVLTENQFRTGIGTGVRIWDGVRFWAGVKVKVRVRT